ncbi:MAG: GNAT family N-acetyltransferase [Quadrisphaera sp.]
MGGILPRLRRAAAASGGGTAAAVLPTGSAFRQAEAVHERMSTQLQTPRLSLSMIIEDDVEELHTIFSDPLTHTVGGGPFTSLRQTEDWVARRAQRYAEHGLAWYAVRETTTAELLGNAGLFMGRAGAEPEIGYEVRSTWQGQGVATDAATEVVAEAVRRGWPRLWATVRPENLASRTVLHRLGFVEDGVRGSEEGPLLYLRRESATASEARHAARGRLP